MKSGKADVREWRRAQEEKLAYFIAKASALPGLNAAAVPDPAGMPFSRVSLAVDPIGAGLDASVLARDLRKGTPSIWVMEHIVSEGKLLLELVPLSEEELGHILARIAEVLSGRSGQVAALSR